MNPDAVLAEAAAADSAALAAAAGVAEEALACHRDALSALSEGWRSETGSAATGLLARQCAEATDVVAALHRAAAELTRVHDDWSDPSGDRPADGSAVEGPPTWTVDASAGFPTPDLLGTAPAPSSPAPVSWDGQTTSPWSAAAPVSPPVPSAGWLPGGSTALPGVGGLPDVGGALVGLVAQIAAMLGSYSDARPDPAPAAPVDAPPAAEDAPSAHDRDLRRPATSSAADPEPLTDSVPSSAVPQSLPPASLPPASPPPAPEDAAAPELLAAERPPDPEVEPEPAPPPPVAVTEPVQMPPAAPAPVAPAPAVEADTPCEIAADELAKVGE